MTTNPVTDFFGTRLDPRALVRGLEDLGLSRFTLTLTDAGVVLGLSEESGGEMTTAKAATWLRGQMSPLLPCSVEHGVSTEKGGVFVDKRRRPLMIVALAELSNEKKDRSGTEKLLLTRLGDVKKGEVCFRTWRRPGGEDGVRPATILAASCHAKALDWLDAAMADAPSGADVPEDILLDGLEWGVARRPTIAVPAPAGSPPIIVDADRCTECGLCAEVCPVSCLTGAGKFKKGGVADCLSCFDCVEACPQDALRPAYSASSATTSRSLARRPGWLSRLRGSSGPALPAPFPPSYLLPAPKKQGKPRWVLGLSVTTMQEHSAALLDAGKVAGAVEEERLSRVRHHGWKSAARPGSTLASDPTLCLEEVLSRRAIGALLAPRRLTLDDMDVLAVNGIPARYRRAYSVLDAERPIPTLRAGRVVFVPHHLCHAASAWRVSGQKDSWILTVDGRGDRETAAVFRARRGRIEQVSSILSLSDHSIGGVYETVTRLLGFGAHGQGSVMALASFGKAKVDLSDFLSLRTRRDHAIHERGLVERFAALSRRPGEPLTRAHKDLAASLQDALEKTILALLEDAGVPRGASGLCLAGGVALNCRMNALIRRTLKPKALFVQPGANDAGTALGAALEAAALLRLPAASALGSAALGPDFTEEEAEAALRHAGLDYRRAGSLAAETAGLLEKGRVVCWCQGRAEFGPRALGARSILADPRRKAMHARVNRIKEREAWRPFGPSVLAGCEKDWFAEAFDSRFMLFTLPLKPGRARKVPAVAHVDETSRPQSVHRDEDPLYHALLSAFHEKTGVPMLLNTSFNRRGEPIVASPRDAVECFLAMPDADVLVMGPFIARRPPAAAASEDDLALTALPGGRRLLLRLTTKCDSDCVHCTLRDIAHLPDRPFPDAVRALAEGRRASCSELVVMRGEAALWPGLEKLLGRARAMGYRFIQLQTSGRPLAHEAARRSLLPLLDAVEMTLHAADEETHDALTRCRGSFREVLMAARAAAAAGREVVLNVPVLRPSLPGLAAVPALAAKLGARRVQFCFPRPVETVDGVETSALARLTEAAAPIQEALRAAARAGVSASTEGVPFCHLAPEQRSGPDSKEDWSRFRVDDLDRLEESLDPERPGTRPEAPACRDCRARRDCPRTWALYLALFGASELAALP